VQQRQVSESLAVEGTELAGVAADGPGPRAGTTLIRPSATPFAVTDDGTSLYYNDWGMGQPVVFVHGGQLGAAMWEYQLLDLVEHGLRTIAYDRRGCGRSSQPWHGYDVDTLADDLAALLAHLDLERVVLVGHSNGCGDIARYLTRHGASRVARVALIAPTTPFLLETEDNPNGVNGSVFDETVAELSRDRPRFFTAGAPAFFGVGVSHVSVSPEMVQWGVGLALQASPRATIAMTRTFAETDFRPDMASFTVPTLVIHGAADMIAPLDLCGRATATRIPGARLAIYETGHGLFLTEQTRLNQDLLAFITG
jgi:non-heme chloroperoxidase